MATSTDRIGTIFQDAREIHADALEMLGQGRVRNAAEKPWGATKRATDALVCWWPWAVTGGDWGNRRRRRPLLTGNLSGIFDVPMAGRPGNEPVGAANSDDVNWRES